MDRRLKILFKFPTRGRPIWFLSTFHQWVSKLSNEYDTDFMIAIDEDDDTMNNDKMIELIHQLGNYSPAVNIIVNCKKYRGTVEAVNDGLNTIDWDVVMPISDSLTPQVPNYDKELIKDYIKHYPDLDGVTYYADGTHSSDLLIHPIMGRSFYNLRGFLYDPEFCYEGAERDLHQTADTMGRLAFIPDIQLFADEPKKYGTDETYTRSVADRENDKTLVSVRVSQGYYSKFKCADKKLNIVGDVK